MREFRDNYDFIDLRDVDIIVDVKDYKQWEDTLKRYLMSPNRFGGHKLFCKDLLIDTWAIDQTWAFREKIIEVKPEDYVRSLPKTVFLNIDAIIFDWTHDCWYDECYVEAMKSRQLDIVLSSNPQIELNILRTFVLQQRYNMTLSNQLQDIIRTHSKCYDTVEDFVDKLFCEQSNRYQKEILSKPQLANVLTNILK